MLAGIQTKTYIHYAGIQPRIRMHTVRQAYRHTCTHLHIHTVRNIQSATYTFIQYGRHTNMYTRILTYMHAHGQRHDYFTRMHTHMQAYRGAGTQAGSREGGRHREMHTCGHIHNTSYIQAIIHVGQSNIQT